jgi:hypothetical protein
VWDNAVQRRSIRETKRDEKCGEESGGPTWRQPQGRKDPFDGSACFAGEREERQKDLALSLRGFGEGNRNVSKGVVRGMFGMRMWVKIGWWEGCGNS